jgi:hypothetical protein
MRYCTTLLASASRTTGRSAVLTVPDDIVGGMFLWNPSAISGNVDLEIQVSPDEGTTFYGVLRFTRSAGSTTKRWLIASFMPFLQAGTEGTATAAGTNQVLSGNVCLTRKFYAYYTIQTSCTFGLYFIGYRWSLGA